MKYITLNSENKIPVMGLGTWKADKNKVYQAVRWAIKTGYRLIDCAHIYGNEPEVGQAVFDAISEGDVKRSDLFIVSKLWNDSHLEADVMPDLQQTLQDLQLDYVDLYLMHWPVAQKKGVEMPQSADDMISLSEAPLDKTWAMLENAYNLGLTKSIGVCNFSIAKLQDLQLKAQISPAVNQVEIHPLLQQNELVDFCHKNMIAVMAYSPLCSSESKQEILADPTINQIAEKLKATPVQVALAWNIARGNVVIPKSENPERIKENFGALSLHLDDDDMQKIAALNQDKRFITGDVFAYGDYTVEKIWE